MRPAPVSVMRAIRTLLGALQRNDDAVFGRLARSLSMVGDTPGQRVLDIGSGTGWLCRSLGGGRELIGLDLTWKGCSAPPSYLFVQADTRALPFGESVFDIVTLFEVLEHIPNGCEQRVLAEVARVLKPGGRFLMSTPNRCIAGMLLDPAWWVRGHRHYAPTAIAGLLEAEGFSDVRVWIEGGWAEALYIPCFYLFSRLGIRIPYESAWRGAIDTEYGRRGWYTVFAIGRLKKGCANGLETSAREGAPAGDR